MNREYTEYRKLNNLDAIFSLSMDPVNCKNILEKIKELMDSSDWYEIDKTTVDKANNSDVTLQLTNLVNDYDSFLEEKILNMEQITKFEQET